MEQSNFGSEFSTMKINLLKLWDSLHSSYWFVPTLMASTALILAFITIEIDKGLQYELISTFGWTYTRGPDGARAILSTVAGSMITVAATAFSITIVALQLASSQFGPRLLRNFMRDTGNQVVLGTFIATFVYCLLVLRTVQGTDQTTFVPNISVTLGVIFALASLGVLIYFIHHAASSIQAEQVIAKVAKELDESIKRLFPDELGHHPESKPQQPVGEIPINFEQNSAAIYSTGSGYLQAIDNEQLMKIANQNDLLLQLKFPPGKYIVQGDCFALVWPKERVNPALNKAIHRTFILGIERNEHQDIEFAISQLVEIAVRALSPGINDPFTAIRCIDRLRSTLSHLVQREMPSAYRFDNNGNLRIIAESVTFASITDTAFNQIRQYGSASVGVMLRLLETIEVIAGYTQQASYRHCLLHHATLIAQDSRQAISNQQDSQKIETAYQLALGKLQSTQ
jgi:uncharacterized membrane protein